MGKRKHSIKFPFNFAGSTYSVTAPVFNLDITSGVTSSIGTQSIFIPENSIISVTFSSASLFLGIQDVSFSGVTIGTFSSSLVLSGSPTSSVFISQSNNSFQNAGRSLGGIIGPIDYTDYFNSNWGATSTSRVVNLLVNSQIVGVAATTGLTSRGLYGYMELTYIYDDTSSRRTSTVCIPYESPASGLSFSSPGKAFPIFCVSPQLTGANGWLNSYSNLAIRHRWMEVKGNCNTLGTSITNLNMQWTFDLGASASLPTRWNQAGSDTYQIYQINALTYSTTATHSFSLWTTVANKWYNMIVNEWITYEYDVSGTTASLNYVELPINYDGVPFGISGAATSSMTIPSRFIRDFDIQEPGPLILRKASVELNYTATSSVTISIRGTGSSFGQNYRRYGMTTNILSNGGQFSLQHGLDNTSANGVGYVLGSGENNINIDTYHTNGPIYCATGLIKILYESGISNRGIDSHNHTLWGYTKNMSFTASSEDIISDNFFIPETSFYLNAAALKIHYWTAVPPNSTVSCNSLIGLNSSEGTGWTTLYEDQIVGNKTGTNLRLPLSYGILYSRVKSNFDSYPGDPDSSRVSLTQSRYWQTRFGLMTRYGYGFNIVYHTINNSLSGNIYGSQGGLVLIDLYEVYSNVDYELYATASVIGNATYSFTIYDINSNYRVFAYENSNSKGTSKTATASNDFNIVLLPIQTNGFGQG